MQTQIAARRRDIRQLDVEIDDFTAHSFFMNFGCVFMAAIAGVLLVGCKKSDPASAPPVEIEVAPTYPTAAQPKLPTIKLWIGAEELVTEMALSQIQAQTGMMFRTNIAENEAMIFVFPYPHQTSFWMKNTPVPLSAAYIDPEGTILEIHDLQPHDTNSVPAKSDNVQFVLETSQGWFERKNIKPGTLVRTEKGSLKETFFRNQAP
jgi:uncharacterized protein